LINNKASVKGNSSHQYNDPDIRVPRHPNTSTIPQQFNQDQDYNQQQPEYNSNQQHQPSPPLPITSTTQQFNHQQEQGYNHQQHTEYNSNQQHQQHYQNQLERKSKDVRMSIGNNYCWAVLLYLHLFRYLYIVSFYSYLIGWSAFII
jgi:Ca2+-dependent lipid-binding protein